MGKSVTVKITGLKEAVKSLHDLPDKIENRAVGKALEDAAQPMLQEAQERAPVHEGVLKEHIVITSSVMSSQHDRGRKGLVRRFVGVITGRDGAPHAPLVEFGTGPRYHKDGKYVGEMPAIPFMRPAYDDQKRGTIQDFAQSLVKVVNAAAAKVRKRPT